MLPQTTTTTKTTTISHQSLPTRVQVACGSWPYLQHVAPRENNNNRNNNNNSNSNNTIIIRNMSIYDYLRQEWNHTAKRYRRESESDEDPTPSPKVRKHNYSNYYQRREEERERERNGGTGNNNTVEDYDIRFFFYLNSLILFTVSCRKYEGDDLKHFIVERIRNFDRVRRKARKRRKRQPKKMMAAEQLPCST
ncbi:Hypothetical predicted protein [Drosophila guanche]|nr:Hypothetical predicted protein [Drosophila guanche]